MKKIQSNKNKEKSNHHPTIQHHRSDTMSWRNKAQITGQNTVPLGTTMRKWGGGGGGGGNENSGVQSYGSPDAGSSYGSYSNRPVNGYGADSVRGIKRERDEVSTNPAVMGSSGTVDSSAPRKRRSRWGEEKTDLGVATALGANMSESELERHAINVRLEEIARKIQSNDVIPPERERSPSPPPTYDAQGRRTNTREVRYRKKLEEERVRLVDKQIKFDPNYKPPAEYAAAKRNMKPSEKVYLPIKEFPEIKFFGLLVGPRGNTLKKMERESGARISIRGKGSLKEGKGRVGEEGEEEMHCVVTADDDEKIKKCIRLINQVIETAASTPETQNDHKRNQLRELAALNGTLRDDENQVCQNCGQKGHRKYDCPEQRNWTAHIVCHRCGQQGHLARDCNQARMQGGPGSAGMQGNGPRPGDPFNAEYENLMAELGEGGRASDGQPLSSYPGMENAPSGPGSSSMNFEDRPIGPDGKKIPPWRDPNVWNTQGFTSNGPPRGPRMGYGAGGRGGPEQNYHQQGYKQQQPYQQTHSQHQWQNGQSDGSGYNYGDWQRQAGGQQGGQAQQTQNGAAEQQPDYREAWEAYYRQQGLDPAAAMAAAGNAGGEMQSAQQSQQQDYTKEWEEYYRQQAAAGGQKG